METAQLINALSRDTRLAGVGLSAVLFGAVAVSAVCAASVFWMMLGPRPDFDFATGTWRFILKFIVTLALAIAATSLLFAAARPGAALRWRAALLAVAPLLLMVAVAVEMTTIPSEAWETRWVGTNALICMSCIPIIGAAPLAVILIALRRSAPSSPGLAGAIAGLVAGGIAATFYAAHCFDDSPMFVATWYPIAVAILAVVGALVGHRLLRW